jgi:hypothetical protein
MRLTSITILVLVGATGCAREHSLIRDYRLYDTGEVQAVAAVEYERDWKAGFRNEYFRNGRLKRSEWLRQGKTWIVVEFHDNGQLKSEERFWPEIVFGAYYAEDGTLVRQVGKKLNWRVEKKTESGHGQ